MNRLCYFLSKIKHAKNPTPGEHLVFASPRSKWSVARQEGEIEESAVAVHLAARGAADDTAREGLPK